MHFRQFDANSRKLAQGQGGVPRYVPDARVATLTQKSRKMAEMPEPALSDSEIGRPKQKKKARLLKSTTINGYRHAIDMLNIDMLNACEMRSNVALRLRLPCGRLD